MNHRWTVFAGAALLLSCAALATEQDIEVLNPPQEQRIEILNGEQQQVGVIDNDQLQQVEVPQEQTAAESAAMGAAKGTVAVLSVVISLASMAATLLLI